MGKHRKKTIDATQLEFYDLKDWNAIAFNEYGLDTKLKFFNVYTHAFCSYLLCFFSS